MTSETKVHGDITHTAGGLIDFLQRFPADTAIEFASEGRDIWPYIEESQDVDGRITLAFVQD